MTLMQHSSDVSKTKSGDQDHYAETENRGLRDQVLIFPTRTIPTLSFKFITGLGCTTPRSATDWQTSDRPTRPEMRDRDQHHGHNLKTAIFGIKIGVETMGLICGPRH